MNARGGSILAWLGYVVDCWLETLDSGKRGEGKFEEGVEESTKKS